MEHSEQEQLQHAYAQLLEENSQLRALVERMQGMEAMLRDREARLQVLLDQLPVVLLTLDREARITSATGTGLRALELDESQMPGQSLHDYFGTVGEDIPVITVYHRALNGEASRCEFEWRKRWYEASVQPLTDSNTVPVGVLMLMTDRTEQRRLQQQVEQAQRLESIGRLAGGIAHDFNNILAAISGFAEIARLNLEADHPMQSALQQILHSVSRGSQMVSQLLAIASRRLITPRPTDLNTLIRDHLPLLQRLLGEDIEVQTHLMSNLGTVRVDAVQIEQVLLNLAANAREAMPAGGKLIIETANYTLGADYSETHWSVQPGDYVLLSVTDTGHGIPPEHLPHIFEPFFTTREEGTGLGLATVHGIITQANGYIWVYSEPGKGTTFKIYLPRIDQPAQPPAAAPTPTHEIPRGHGSILLVEDDDSTRDAITQMLIALGYTVLPVVSPAEAIEQFERQPTAFDLLITDVVLPQMSSTELTERLQRLNPNLRVLFISGYTANAIAERGELKPGIELLEKPFTLAQLAQRLQKLLTD